MILAPDARDTMAAPRRQIDRAIMLKPRENLPARTTGRVAEVIAGVRDGAAQRGLDPDQVN